MSNIKHVQGNLVEPSSFIENFNSTETAIFLCHQTNAFGVMGAGVALALANKYPEILETYEDYCNTNLHDVLGSALFTMTNTQAVCVVNLFGQPTLNSQRDTNYECIYTALEEFFSYLSDYPEWTIAFPKNMSSALAGGKWKIIYSMIESLAKDLPNDIYIVEYIVPEKVNSHATSPS